jgi:uncharacterized protein (TIGR03435 family)
MIGATASFLVYPRRIAVFALSAATLLAQLGVGVPPNLRFEVASLKASPPAAPAAGIRPAEGGARYIASGCSIKGMITVANRIKADQVIGGSAWLDSELYDMEAKAEKPSTADELHVMLMNLLVDRLQLKYHREKRDMKMYALTVAQDGPKLTPHEPQSPHDSWLDVAQEKFLHLKLTFTAVPLDYAAFALGGFVDLPVVDMTRIKGNYDFILRFTRELPVEFPAGRKVNGEDPDLSGPNIFQAVQQQLGLEMKPQRGPVDIIVIDHVEKPTAN